MTADTRWDVASVRSQFPILSRQIGPVPLVYLDNAATSQKPLVVIEATDAFYRMENANVHRGVHMLSQRATDQFEAARESVRRFINAADARECVFTKGCTEGVNLVAQSFARPMLKPGDEILITHIEHHSNIVPWQMVAEQTGAVLKVLPITDQCEWDMAALDDLLTERTRIVAAQHVSNAVGTIHPIKDLIRRAKDVGAFVLVDGAQAGPHLQIDVRDLGADFYTLSCHKIFAPTGVGVLYGKLNLLEEMAPYQGGGSMIRTVSFEKTTYAPAPEKFEGGTPNIAGVVGLGVALEWLMSLDRDAAEAHERSLVAYAYDQLTAIPGVRIYGPRDANAGLVSFTVEGAHPHDVGTVLDSNGVAVRAGHHCCMPLMKRLGVPATARASFSLYNTFEEVDALVAGVRTVKEIFG